MNDDFKKYMGKKVGITFKNAVFTGTVTDLKRSYGSLRIKMKPDTGMGETDWLENFAIINEKSDEK